ncbi:hypothetical protein SAMN05216337_101597 [Bradyrhizobium brasilense]|uniref:Uncharacterized protein n=1 Tax=Bradyrhizobium brasilense TaxID=1419277 RepID=A0A1G6XQN8_9BRAD|nr:hypothetical protein [Bradyrhizobium brasilense]SDD79636.1 hypothetical protein SAMN05216337_101597 [Bradyrhizobium brasilense]
MSLPRPSKELAPEEDQGIVFALTKAPKYANIDYLDYYGAKLEKAFRKFSETDLSFVLNGSSGCASRHGRNVAEAMGRAQTIIDRA